MEANNERIGLTGSTPEISFASSSSLPLFHIFICSSTWTAGIGRNNVLTNSPPRLGCSFTHLFAGRSRAHKMKNHSSPIESTYRDNLAPAILPLSASQSTGHLNRLGGRENQKYEHLDKTKDLRKGGRKRGTDEITPIVLSCRIGWNLRGQGSPQEMSPPDTPKLPR
jgi:hypothetical protein